MSDKITNLPDGGSVQDTDEFVAARSGANVKIAGSALSTGGSITPPVVLTGTDPDSAVLEIHPPSDMPDAGLQLKVFDKSGDLALDVDALGILDVRAFNVQSPPDTGGGTGSSSAQVLPARWVINSGSDTTDDPLAILKWNGADGYRPRLNVKYTDSEILEFSPIAGEVCATVIAPATPTGNAIELWDHPFNNLLFAVTYTGGVIFPSADPHVAGAWWDNAGTLTRSSG